MSTFDAFVAKRAAGSQIVCSLGMGCEEAGMCYAAANNQPEQCGVNIVDADQAPSPIDGHSERERAKKDADTLGIGFLIDGQRIDPNRVVMLRGMHYPQVTTSELWNALEGVLRDKGATDAWIEYALPDLQVAATQYAGGQWAQGHAAGAAGDPLPNPQTPGDAFTPGVEPMPEPAPALGNAELDAGISNHTDPNKRGFIPD